MSLSEKVILYSGESTFGIFDRMLSSTPASFSRAENSKKGCSYFRSSSVTRSRTLISHRLVFRIAEILDRACGALWPLCGAFGPAVMDEQMCQENPFFDRNQPHQVLLDLVRPRFPGEIQPA